jgi:hypothetical protein
MIKDERTQIKRPISITIVCAIVLLGILLALLRLAVDIIELTKPLEPEVFKTDLILAIFLFLVIILESICLVGMWRMQKVAVTAYSLVFFIILIIAISLRIFDPYTLIVPVIVLILMTQFSKHMQ